MGLVDTVKDMVVLVQKADNVELLKQVLALQNDALRTTQEVQQLKDRIRELEGLLAASKAMTFRAPFYFATDDPVAFCPRCWEKDHKALHLLHTPPNYYECHSCKTTIRWPHDNSSSGFVSSEPRVFGGRNRRAF